MRAVPAYGVSRRQSKQISLLLDEDTFEQVHAIARGKGISMNEQLRLLIEWGLMEIEEKDS